MFRNSNKDLSDKESGEESGNEDIVNESPKKNKLSLWGEVLNDQILSSELGMQCGVDRNFVERSVESYHIPFMRELKKNTSNNSSKYENDDSDESIDEDVKDNKRTKMNDGLKKRLGTNKSNIKVRLGEKKVLVSDELEKKHPLSERLGIREGRRKRKERFNVILTLEDSKMEALISSFKLSSFINGLLEAFKEPLRVKPIFENALETIGLDKGKKLLKQTQQVQLEGGMLTLDGSRRRSIGGVFLQLLKSVTNKEQQAKIFQNKKNYYYKNKFKNNVKTSEKNLDNDKNKSANDNNAYANNIFSTEETSDKNVNDDEKTNKTIVEDTDLEGNLEDGELMNFE